MALPEPTSSFTIPSLYDGIRLSCRLYAPPSPSRSRRKVRPFVPTVRLKLTGRPKRSEAQS
jgi:hypothetical protein